MEIRMTQDELLELKSALDVRLKDMSRELAGTDNLRLKDALRSSIARLETLYRRLGNLTSPDDTNKRLREAA